MPGCSHRRGGLGCPYRRAVRRHSYIRQRQTSNSVLCLWEASLVLFARFRGTSNLVFLDKKDIEEMSERVRERREVRRTLTYFTTIVRLRYGFAFIWLWWSTIYAVDLATLSRFWCEARWNGAPHEKRGNGQCGNLSIFFASCACLGS